jgi:hypothetical protein
MLKAEKPKLHFHVAVSLVFLAYAGLHYARLVAIKHVELPRKGISILLPRWDGENVWEPIIGITSFFFALVLPHLATWKVKRIQSIHIPRHSEGPDGSFGLWRRAATPLDIPVVTALFDGMYPYTSGARDARAASLERWATSRPSSVVMILSTKRNVLVGCSVLLPIKRSAYVAYRNGYSDPFWREDELADPETPSADPLSLYSTFFCHKIRGAKGEGWFLREVFLEHVVTLLGEFGGSAGNLAIIGPRKSPNGRKSMLRLGARLCGRSKGGYDLYELDFRQSTELNDFARHTLIAISSRLTNPTGHAVSGLSQTEIVILSHVAPSRSRT